VGVCVGGGVGLFRQGREELIFLANVAKIRILTRDGYPVVQKQNFQTIAYVLSEEESILIGTEKNGKVLYSQKYKKGNRRRKRR